MHYLLPKHYPYQVAASFWCNCQVSRWDGGKWLLRRCPDSCMDYGYGIPSSQLSSRATLSSSQAWAGIEHILLLPALQKVGRAPIPPNTMGSGPHPMQATIYSLQEAYPLSFFTSVSSRFCMIFWVCLKSQNFSLPLSFMLPVCLNSGEGTSDLFWFVICCL